MARAAVSLLRSTGMRGISLCSISRDDFEDLDDDGELILTRTERKCGSSRNVTKRVYCKLVPHSKPSQCTIIHLGEYLHLTQFESTCREHIFAWDPPVEWTNHGIPLTPWYSPAWSRSSNISLLLTRTGIVTRNNSGETSCLFLHASDVVLPVFDDLPKMLFRCVKKPRKLASGNSICWSFDMKRTEFRQNRGVDSAHSLFESTNVYEPK